MANIPSPTSIRADDLEKVIQAALQADLLGPPGYLLRLIKYKQFCAERPTSVFPLTLVHSVSGIEYKGLIVDPLVSDFGSEPTEEGLYLPMSVLSATQGVDLSYFISFGGWSPWPSYPGAGLTLQPEKATPKKAADFSVNMMEPLSGWRQWYINKATGLLRSVNTRMTWPILEPLIAKCKLGSRNYLDQTHGKDCPDASCVCGIYAANDPDSTPDADVLGEVYGWGRYVRGNKGWRAQFAYPKSFHLEERQDHLLPLLMRYRVPIYIAKPTKIYDPVEDGYGNWQAEAHGNLGTTLDPDPEED